MLFSNDKCKARPQAGGTEHMNAEKSIEKDLGFVLVHQLNVGQQQHTTMKQANLISEINRAAVNKKHGMVLPL